MGVTTSEREGIKLRARMVRDELAGPKPTAVEWHLAEAASVAWLDWHRCALEIEGLDSGVSLRIVAWHEQRVDRANWRFIRALKALTAARKVDTTAIEINIGDTAGPVPREVG
jgi:hypothetical protein